jgi:hypothetical protein
MKSTPHSSLIFVRAGDTLPRTRRDEYLPARSHLQMFLAVEAPQALVVHHDPSRSSRMFNRRHPKRGLASSYDATAFTKRALRPAT